MNSVKKNYFSRFKEIVKDQKISKESLEIFEYIRFFTDNEDNLVTALVATPFQKTKNLPMLKQKYGKKVYHNLLELNQLFERNKDFVNNFCELGCSNCLYLTNFKVASENRKNNMAKKLLTKSNANFVLKVLKGNKVSKIKKDVGDIAFRIADPKTFEYYESLLALTKKSYEILQKKIKKDLTVILKEGEIKGEIQARVKSIYSLYQKIVKKNIIYSQVLDVVGFRVIVPSVRECYQLMDDIIIKWSIVNSKIKDYIAIPKKNGYQSIHLTVFINNFPIEIQIRTEEMHWNAEFGGATHIKYKNYEGQ